MIKRFKVVDYATQEEKARYWEKFGENPDTRQTFQMFFRVQNQLPEKELGYYLDDENGYTYESFKELINNTLQAQKSQKASSGQPSQAKINKDKFVKLYGEDNYNDYIALKEKNFIDKDYVDIYYWVSDDAASNVGLYKAELSEVIQEAKEKEEIANTPQPIQVVEEEEVDPEEEARKAREQVEEEERANTSKIVEGPGVEYITGNSKWRVYKVTSPEGAVNFALPSSQGKGWCISGSDYWAKHYGGDKLDAANAYWVNSYAPFYFFMTEPMGRSFAFYKSGNRWCWNDAKTDAQIAIPEDVPLWLPGLPEGLQALSKVKPVIVEQFVITNDTLTSITNKNLDRYIIPAAVKIIGNNVFEGCTRMKSVLLQGPTRTIGRQAFKGCSSLERVDVRGKIERLDFGAFEDCSSLKTIDVSGTAVIPMETFKNCSKLESIKVSNNLAQIDKEAFSGCVSLRTIFIPEHCTVADTAFNYCRGLTVLTNAGSLPESWEIAMGKVNKVKFGSRDSLPTDMIEAQGEPQNISKKFLEEYEQKEEELGALTDTYNLYIDKDTVAFDNEFVAKDIKCAISKNGEEPKEGLIKELRLEVFDDNGDTDAESIELPEVIEYKDACLVYDDIYDGYDTYYAITFINFTNGEEELVFEKDENTESLDFPFEQ